MVNTLVNLARQKMSKIPSEEQPYISEKENEIESINMVLRET